MRKWPMQPWELVKASSSTPHGKRIDWYSFNPPILFMTATQGFLHLLQHHWLHNVILLVHTAGGNCPDYAVARQMKLLGTVNSDEFDMTFKNVASQSQLLKKQYKICRPNQNMTCSIKTNIPNLNTSKKLIEKMPFIPGTDNLATITPVELVRYHLERPAANSPDSKILLMRSTATIVGGQLSFERAHILMSGIQSIVFTRNNVSNPTIEYKLIKVRYQKAIK